jgi:hypothetical protein
LDETGVQIPVAVTDFCLHENFHTDYGAHLTLSSMGTKALSRGLDGWGVKLITHLFLVSRLRVSGAIFLLLLYAFMSWTGKVFPPEKCHVVLRFVAAFLVMGLNREIFSSDSQT